MTVYYWLDDECHMTRTSSGFCILTIFTLHHELVSQLFNSKPHVPASLPANAVFSKIYIFMLPLGQIERALGY